MSACLCLTRVVGPNETNLTVLQMCQEPAELLVRYQKSPAPQQPADNMFLVMSHQFVAVFR